MITILNLLSYPDSALRLLDIQLTQEERESAVTPETTRRLLLQKLQERF